MVPGIEDVMFTVSVKYDVVAIDPFGHQETTSLQRSKDDPQRFKENTILLYK